MDELSNDPFLKEMLNNANDQSKARGYSLEYLEGALDWVLSITRTKLDETDRARHLVKLSMYPHWKIKKIGEFSGYFSELYKYLDGLHAEPEYFKPIREVFPDAYLLEDQGGKNNDRMAKDVFAHIKKMSELMGNFRPSKLYLKDRDPERYEQEREEWLKKKRQVEKAGLEELDRKYPHATFNAVLREKRLAGL
jgi:hypothetical protein